jgi:hypothetical protein
MSALIRVALSQKELQIEPGQKGEVVVTVQNLSEIVDQLSVEVEGLDTAWFTVSPPNVSLFPQDQGEVKVSLHPPSGAKAGRYDLAVKAISRENPVEWTRVQATLEVMPVSFFDISLSPQRKSIVGEEATFQVQLTNPGNVDLTLSLSATDPEEACLYLFQPQTVTVEAGGSRGVPLRVRPKDGPPEEGRRYDFTVKAVPAGAPHKAREVLGQLECKPLVISFEVAVSPQKQSTKGKATFRVQLTNFAENEIALDLGATDTEGACTCRFPTDRVTLAAGERKELSLVVAPKKMPAAGEMKTYDLTVKATPAAAPHLAQTAAGQLEVVRPKRRWRRVLASRLLPALDPGIRQELCRNVAIPGLCPGEELPWPVPEPTERPEEERPEEERPEEEPPEAEFWADPDEIPRGDCAVLRWWVSAADVVALEGPGLGFEVPLEGAREVCPEGPTEYLLVVIHRGQEYLLHTEVHVVE